MAKQQDYQIPFDPDGNLMSYPRRTYVKDEDTGERRPVPPRMVDNYEFEATMTYHGFDNGIRSAHRIIWRDEEGHTYPMFISRFGEALEAHGMQGNQMTGRWTFMKQGENYSLRAVKPAKPKKGKKAATPTKAPDAYVSSSAYESMRKERDRLLAVVDLWNKVCSEVVARPIYQHIWNRVDQESRKIVNGNG